MQSESRADAHRGRPALIAGVMPPGRFKVSPTLFRSIDAAAQSARLKAHSSATEPWIYHTRAADVGVIASHGVALLLAGSLRFRGEQNWLSLNDPERLGMLARAWASESSATLKRLHGIFLLVAVDENRGETIAAVDRMGAVPFCYGLTRDQQLVMATTASLVASHPLLGSRLAAQALYNYAQFHVVPSPGTVFERISKLEPAQFLRYRDGRLELGHYWEPEFAQRASGSIEANGERLRTALESSVRRAVNGAATGTFLSGGIDSSTVTGMLARAGAKEAPAYSMGFKADGYDEARYARITAKHFGVPLRQFYVTPEDVQRELMIVAETFDEPFGNASAIPTLVCARRAKSDGVERLLAGDGGDELFGGNTRYARQKIFEVYHSLPAWSRSQLLEPLLLGWRLPERVPILSKIASYVEQARMPMPDRTESYNFLVRTPLDSIFEPAFLSVVNPRQPFELLRNRYAAAPTRSLVDRMLYLDWKFTLADNDLRKVGRMCELAGIEVRYPWLDDEVIELSTSLPADWKVHGQTLRYFAKRALTGFLPDAVIGKSKHGFGLPFGEWLKTSPALQEQMYALLDALKRRSIVQPTFVDTLIQHHRAGHAAYFGTMVWVFAMLEAWLQAHRLDL
jgi:asparagine synthase (glutamine-hydrolysing)